MVECRGVPQNACLDYAANAVAGAQPSDAGTVVQVTVTCERNPPCEPDRRDSGGRIILTYDDGTTFAQDWAFGSGT